MNGHSKLHFVYTIITLIPILDGLLKRITKMMADAWKHFVKLFEIRCLEWVRNADQHVYLLYFDIEQDCGQLLLAHSHIESRIVLTAFPPSHS